MKIAVFGANGPTGRLVTEQALAAGHTVTAITRHPDLFPLKHDRLHVMRGDVFDLSSVKQAVAGQDAVLSSLGVPYSPNPITVYSQGVSNIMQAMQDCGIRRIVCVSSSAVEVHRDPNGSFVTERIVTPLIQKLGRTLYEDMRRMEALLKKSGLEWTVVRSAGLFETPEVTPYQMAEGRINTRFTSRSDLAACMLHQLTSDQYVRKVVAVGTVAVKPNMLKLALKESFQKRPK